MTIESMKKKVAARGQGGFTLIELLVVIAILSILAGVVVFAVGSSTDKANLAACKTERSSIITAWAAADTMNQVDDTVAQETWDTYMKDAELKWFAAPAADGSAARINTTKVAGTECEPIPVF